MKSWQAFQTPCRDSRKIGMEGQKKLKRPIAV